ncbi:hypothetical protein N4P33_16695 [Streptomyces sp. 15-116A]|uniref:hypothetical protein n=1 Tax=Streptomyces sp. 15-116A TaxID=2259035 RepID=UPI0021B2A6F3|nr:hypothetical protein [Streptomyces sp. 15-116A]MCT7353796.1 hypothetical protein [Streptomyces sp. 15-116A]
MTDLTTLDHQPAKPRRGADPVKALLHRHRELCETAVDPLEIAAGLEAHGVTDRTAARFRHRDVFSLAEELYARANHHTTPPPPTPPAPQPRRTWSILTVLPGLLCLATIAALRLTEGRPRLLAATAGTLALTLALRAALRRGPLSAPHAPGTTLPTLWLIAYAVLGEGLLHAALTGGPDTPPTTADWPLITAPVAALTLACAPAAWTTHLFRARAHRRLTTSRALEDFATSVRPLLLGTVTLHLLALAALTTLTATALDEPAALPATLTLGALLYVSRLLTIHGFTHAPRVILTATALTQAAALATLFTARLPGCAPLATPVETLVTTWTPAAVPTLTCGAAALTLLVHAARKLTRASAHVHAEADR